MQMYFTSTCLPTHSVTSTWVFFADVCPLFPHAVSGPRASSSDKQLLVYFVGCWSLAVLVIAQGSTPLPQPSKRGDGLTSPGDFDTFMSERTLHPIPVGRTGSAPAGDVCIKGGSEAPNIASLPSSHAVVVVVVAAFSPFMPSTLSSTFWLNRILRLSEHVLTSLTRPAMGESS
uniref:Secreted protein n=1 Tax=Panagrellus redivivus TaxID=6233 RepID=A0A7E4UUX6_PANRE